MSNANKPAVPTMAQDKTTGLTKLEYAAVHIMAAHCGVPAFMDTHTDKLAAYSVEAARALFAELEKNQ